MSKVNHSAGDSATASSTASLHAVTATARGNVSAEQLAHLFDEIASLSHACRILLGLLEPASEQQFLRLGVDRLVAQIGWLADMGQGAATSNGLSVERVEDWLLPETCSRAVGEAFRG